MKAKELYVYLSALAFLQVILIAAATKFINELLAEVPDRTPMLIAGYTAVLLIAAVASIYSRLFNLTRKKNHD